MREKKKKKKIFFVKNEKKKKKKNKTCSFLFAEYPYKFVKVLKSQQLVEKETLTLVCELDDAGGEVKWFKGDQEIVPDKRWELINFCSFFLRFKKEDSFFLFLLIVNNSCRVQIKEDGRKRKLIIKDTKVTDAGQYSCVSNADKTEAEIVINCKY